jgi:integrating conjugative element membrane protein (TIGR03745 family)
MQKHPQSQLIAAMLAFAASCNPPVAWAALPTVDNPTRGVGSGILDTLQNYGYDIVMLLALIVVASIFVGVCYHSYNMYKEVQANRAKWGDFGLTVAVGAALLVIGIWLLTKATGVL